MPKLALPDGNAQTDALDISDVASAWIVNDDEGRLMILLITKSGEPNFARHTEANVAYLVSIGLAPSHFPSAPKVALKP